MPKHRTRKAASKRFKVSKNGKVMHRSHYTRHLRSKKSKRQLRALKQTKQVHGRVATKIKKMLGLK